MKGKRQHERSTPIGLALLDRHLRYRRVNERLAAISGKTVREHIGQAVQELMPDLSAQIAQVCRQSLATGESVLDVPITGPTAADSLPQRTLRLSCHPVRDSAGIVDGVEIAVCDVTDPERANAELHRWREKLANQMQAAAVRELKGFLAHELSQPLTAIRSNGQAAQHLLNRSDPDLGEVRGALADIVSDSRRAGTVVEKLRTAAGYAALDKQPLALNEIIAEAVALLSDETQRKDAAIETDLGAGLPRVFGDRSALRLVFITLLQNNFEALADRRAGMNRWRIQTRLATATELAVTITGGDDDWCKERPNQLRAAFSSAGTGSSGLSFAICGTIVEAHGGRLSMKPGGKRGATFCVTLPIGSAATL